MRRQPTDAALRRTVQTMLDCAQEGRSAMRQAWMAMAICATADAARATGISDEAGINTTQSTPQNPRAGNFSDAIDVTGEVTEGLQLSAGALVTVEGATPAPAGSAFGNRGGVVGKFSAGLEYQANEKWSFGISGNVSPQSTQRSGTQLNVTSASGTTSAANALLQANSSSGSAGLTAAYDSAGESALEWSIDGGVTLAHFDTDQRIVALQNANGNVETSAAVVRYCQTHPCSAALRRVIGPQPAATLDSGELSLTGTATIVRDTDLSVSGDYYAYKEDASQVGYFSVGSAGRVQMAGGAGVPIAPLRYLVKPAVAQRFGDFSVRAWVQAGRYVQGGGQTTRGAGVKLQYKLTRAFKMWVTATAQRDVDSEGAISKSFGATFGAGYKF
jgi:hypothetical protein